MITNKYGLPVSEAKYGMNNNYLFLLASSARIIRTNYLIQSCMEPAATEMTIFIELLNGSKHELFGDDKYHNHARHVKLRLPERSPVENDLVTLQA